MKIRELMNSPVETCRPSANLAEVARQMWDADCGAVPVVARDGKPLGIITDRDICMAAAIRSRPCSEIPVSEVVAGELFSCAPEDDTSVALRAMAEHQVRRLPVVDSKGQLVGMLSMNDLCLEARKSVGKGADRAPSYEECLEALQAISAHRHGLAAQPGTRRKPTTKAAASRRGEAQPEP